MSIKQLIAASSMAICCQAMASNELPPAAEMTFGKIVTGVASVLWSGTKKSFCNASSVCGERQVVQAHTTTFMRIDSCPDQDLCRLMTKEVLSSIEEQARAQQIADFEYEEQIKSALARMQK